MILPEKFREFFKIWQENGWKALKNHLHFQAIFLKQKSAYQRWISEFDTLNDLDRKNIRNKIATFPHKPLVSILLPVYDIEEKWLRLCLESVKNQLYENWELCIADDCSPSPHIRRILEEYKEKDDRIKVKFRSQNGHISAASNSALELANGEFTILLDHDDELSEHALFYVVKELNNFPETDMIYSDEDLIDKTGRRFDPKFKPDWSRDLFYSTNLITHLSAYRTEILRKIGGFTIGLEGSQDYDLALRFIEEIPEKNIRHIPKILYHWRVIKGSVALDQNEKPYAHKAARKAIHSHLKRLGKKAKVTKTIHNLHRVQYELPKNLPKVSVIVHSEKNFDLEGLKKETEYKNIELIRIPANAENLAKKYNQIIGESSGEVLCFLDGGLQPFDKNWLKELVSFAMQKEIGAVGGKILSKQKSVLGSGLIMGINNSVGIAHHNFPSKRNGMLTRNCIIGNFSAISISCFATHRRNFEKIGGFDETHFPNNFFDVDYCLKLWDKNLRIAFNPYIEFMQIHQPSISKLKRKENLYLQQKWKDIFEDDPFYNPNLSKKHGHSLISFLSDEE